MYYLRISAAAPIPNTTTMAGKCPAPKNGRCLYRKFRSTGRMRSIVGNRSKPPSVPLSGACIFFPRIPGPQDYKAAASPFLIGIVV